MMHGKTRSAPAVIVIHCLDFTGCGATVQYVQISYSYVCTYIIVICIILLCLNVHIQYMHVHTCKGNAPYLAFLGKHRNMHAIIKDITTYVAIDIRIILS